MQKKNTIKIYFCYIKYTIKKYFAYFLHSLLHNEKTFQLYILYKKYIFSLKEYLKKNSFKARGIEKQNSNSLVVDTQGSPSLGPFLNTLSITSYPATVYLFVYLDFHVVTFGYIENYKITCVVHLLRVRLINFVNFNIF